MNIIERYRSLKQITDNLWGTIDEAVHEIMKDKYANEKHVYVNDWHVGSSLIVVNIYWVNDGTWADQEMILISDVLDTIEAMNDEEN